MSKAALIRKRLEQGLSTHAIAAELGCHDAYVRAVKQRMLAGGLTAADRRWQASEYRREMNRQRSQKYYRKLRGDPELWTKKLAHQREYKRWRYHTDPEFRARQNDRVRRWHRLKKAQQAEASP